MQNQEFAVFCDRTSGQVRSVQLFGQELLDAQNPCVSELWVNGQPLKLRPHVDPNQPAAPHLTGVTKGGLGPAPVDCGVEQPVAGIVPAFACAIGVALGNGTMQSVISPLGLDPVGVHHRQAIAIGVVVELQRLAIRILNAHQPLQLIGRSRNTNGDRSCVVIYKMWLIVTFTTY